jgi:squalene cyclase
MNLNYNPFPIIFELGDDALKLACLIFFGYVDSPKGKLALLELIKKQRSDGGFPSQLDPDKWGMLETVRNSLLLLEAGLPSNGTNIIMAVDLILKNQNDDGGWCENPLIGIPQERVELSNKQSVTWLTADIINLLHQINFTEQKQFKRAIKWLKGKQNVHGGWTCFTGCIGDKTDTIGDPDSTAQITFLIREMFGEKDNVYQKGKKVLEFYINKYIQDIEKGYWLRLRDGRRQNIEVYHLTHLFLASLFDRPRRFQNGYNINDLRVKRMMETLIEIQEADGGWIPFWAKESSPVYTLLAVKVLIYSGMLKREDLKEYIKEYAF